MSKNTFTADGGPHKVDRVLAVADGLRRIGEFESAEMLTAFAERIEADESAVRAACEIVGIMRENDDGKYIDWTVEGSLDALELGDALYCIDGIEVPDDGFTELFIHPPAQAAQAAQVDGTEQAMDWFLGEFGDLNPATACLVWNFALALGNKLADAEKKYGYTDGWRSPDWMDECRTKLMSHIRKGDPRDVAAYCAFLWHHGASTAPAAEPVAQGDSALQDELECERERSQMLDDLCTANARALFRAIHPGEDDDRVEYEQSHDITQKAIAALAAQPRAVPDGWVLVPREATKKMLTAAHSHIDWCRDRQNTNTVNHPSQNQNGGTNCEQDLRDAWNAMCAAAPSPRESS